MTCRCGHARHQHNHRHDEYQAGLDDGVTDAAHCNTRDDTAWYLRVVSDNLLERRPRYVAGYTDAFACLL